MITSKPICVTGASGFIASRIVAELLRAGYTVRGTVRGPTNTDRHTSLASLPEAPERLSLVQAELLTESSYDAAVSGCEYVIHTASPYVLHVRDAQRDLIEPAVSGTLNVLRACAKAGSVKKVVLTSSAAAVLDEPVPGHEYTEDDWNQRSSLSRNPYYYSKTMAERSAWQFHEQQTPPFDLVVINPALVIGPSFIPSLNTSNQLLRDILTGRMPIIMSLAWGIVDVRDVAHAHVLSMEKSDAKGRYLCVSETLSMEQVIRILREAGFDNYKLPKLKMTGKIGSTMAKMMVSTQPKGVRTFIRTHVGRTLEYDNTKIRKDLGIVFRPAKESILETVEDLIRWGHLSGKPAL